MVKLVDEDIVELIHFEINFVGYLLIPRLRTNVNVISLSVILSVGYTCDLYYDNGYLKATIKNGSTTVYSYEGNVSNIISFDKF